MRRAHLIYGSLVSGKIILSSFIFPSKPTDPRRNKLDIFNSCWLDFSILIPVLTTASQLLLWLQHFNSCPDDSISTPALTSAFYFLSWWQHLNSCFDFSILFPVLKTASQLLLWLQHFNSCPDDSISIPALTSASLLFVNSTTAFLLPATYSTRVPFVSSCY